MSSITSGTGAKGQESLKRSEGKGWTAVEVDAGPPAISAAGGSTPFRMALHQSNKKRKRKLSNSAFAGNGNPSNGGNGEDDSTEESGEKAQTENVNVPVERKTQAKAREVNTSKATENGADSNASAGNQSFSQPQGWRVKLYRLNADGSWDDCGTGRIMCLYRPQEQQKGALNQQQQQSQVKGNKSAATPGSDQWLYQETGEATLCVHAEVTEKNRQPRVLLRTRILLKDDYQRQGDNIITWCEPCYGQQGDAQNRNAAHNHHAGAPGSSSGVDLALSFQDNAGCLDIWRQITNIQQCAAELLRQHEQPESAQDIAAQVAAEHHSDLQRQQQQELWAQLSDDHNNPNPESDMHYNNMMEQALVQTLPNPPSLQNLEEIADTIAALQHAQHAPQQREALALWIAKDECSYLKQLLALFPAAEAKGDYGKLAMLAACVKTVLLFNEPSILELVINHASMFEEVCSCLEYDPDLREKANHRWFLQERAKFRTVVAIEDQELISAIHRSFRVNFLRDTLLRPTMDESALTTLSSLLTFTHADVVKGVMLSGAGKEVDLKDSYLVRVIRLLGVELHTLTALDWIELERSPYDDHTPQQHKDDLLAGDPSIVVGEPSVNTTSWKQYLAPQDRSPASRRLRKRGCLTFLRELFNMVRISLQQCDKDNFFPVICTLAIDLNEDHEPDNASQTSQTVEVGSVASTVKSSAGGDADTTMHVIGSSDMPLPQSPVTLLTLLACVLSDPNADVSERSCALEIISGVAMHDPSLIRLCCLEFHESWKNNGGPSIKPEANDRKQVVFYCPPQDLLASLLFLLVVESDAGILLQVSEILRIILDTDVTGDQGSLNAGLADEGEGIPPGSQQGPLHDQHNQPSGAAATSTDQKQFLSLFYDCYVAWLVSPFQFAVFHPTRRVPESVLLNQNDSSLMQHIMAKFKAGIRPDNQLLRSVSSCAVRSSFAVELLSFCVRAHLYRMKFFLLKSRVLGNVLKLLGSNSQLHSSPGDRCLKLAALRLLRAILSVKDEFYHRHIVQHDLFAPVFEAFRSNPVGDNLVSSAIVEMCDYIHKEDIKSLLEYIVTKHLSPVQAENASPSLEDVSGPYVSTLTVLRVGYESSVKEQTGGNGSEQNKNASPASPGSRYFGSPSSTTYNAQQTRQLTGNALKDQRRFRQMGQEESYFGDDEDVPMNGATSTPNASPVAQNPGPRGVDEVDMVSIQKEGEVLNTQRMFFGREPRIGVLPTNGTADNLAQGKNEEA